MVFETNKSPQQPPRWKKKAGTGPHRLRDGRLLKGQEVFRAWENELLSFIDKFEPVDDPDIPSARNIQATFTPVHKGRGKYDVVDSQGRAINDVLLDKEQAMALVNGDVNAETQKARAEGEGAEEAPEGAD